jgi:prophage regulatory protein
MLQAEPALPADRFLGKSPTTISIMVGLTKPTIYNRVKAGTFPAPMRLGPRSVGFFEDEITAWQESLPRGFGQPVNKQVAEA